MEILEPIMPWVIAIIIVGVAVNCENLDRWFHEKRIKIKNRMNGVDIYRIVENAKRRKG